MTETEDLSRFPPCDVEAEQAVLGAILWNAAVLDTVLEILTAKDFYKSAHQMIFKAMCRLTERNDAVDTVTLADELERCGDLASVGGRGYCAELLTSVPSASNVAAHCKVVQDKARRRQLRALGHDLLAKANDTPIAEILDHLEQKAVAISRDRESSSIQPIDQLVKERIAYLDSLYKQERSVTGVATGFEDLDAVTAGLQPGNLIIIGARPSIGKTTLALNIAVHAALREKLPVLMFSLEMQKGELTDRILSALATVDGHSMRTGLLDAAGWRRLAEASATFDQAPLFIDDTGALSITQIRSRSRWFKSKHGLALLVVDYLQLVRGRSDSDNREREISDISRALKALAKELSVPIIALSQLSRAVEARKPPIPMLADLRESGAIEQDADVVLFIYREEVYDRDTERKGVADILLSKQRNGPTGEVQLVFQNPFSRFLSMPNC